MRLGISSCRRGVGVTRYSRCQFVSSALIRSPSSSDLFYWLSSFNGSIVGSEAERGNFLRRALGFVLDLMVSPPARLPPVPGC